MKILVTSFIFLSFLLVQNSAEHFERISIADGLSQNFISAIYQDSRGMMWFGTKDGLNRYDGVRFTIFRYEPSDTTTLSHNYISAIYEDKSGALWIGTIDGLNKFDRATETFTRYINTLQDSTSISHNCISSIVEDSLGSLWIGTRGGGLNEYRNGIFRRYKLSNNDIYSITLATDNILWITTVGGGLHRFDAKKFSFKKYSLSDDLTYGIISSSNKLFVGTKSGLDIFNPRTSRSANFSISGSVWKNMRVTNMLLASDGNLWLNAYGFIALFDTAAEKYETIHPSTGYTVFFQDKSGIIWIGTTGNGVLRYNPLNKQFGLKRKDILDDILPALHKTKFNSEQTNARSIIELSDATFILTYDGILVEISHDGKKFSSITVPLKPDDIQKTNLLAADSSGNLWMGIDGGVMQFNRSTKKFRRIELYPKNSGMTATRYYDITALFCGHDGAVWIGTPKLGLVRYTPSSGEKKFFSYNQNNVNTISHNFILSIAEDPLQPNEILWIGTDGGGLNKFNMHTETFFRFTEREGLPSNVVYGIASDTNNNLWLSTNKGIVRFSPENGEMRTFTVGNGLQSNEFNRYEFYKSRDGKIFFGGINGSNRFIPEQIKLNTFVPAVQFTEFRLFNRPIKNYGKNSPLQRAIGETDSITLNYDENIFSVEFAALEFTAPKENRFQYQLAGFSDDWIQLGTARNVTFTNLDAGEYTLRVKGSNSDGVPARRSQEEDTFRHTGVWNEQPATLHITIVPPFWQTVWFRISAAFILVALISGIVRYVSVKKMQEQMRELERQRALEKERLRISADMHDDIGGRLTHLGLLSENLQRNNEEKISKENLTAISSAAREIIDSFDEIVWAVNPKYDTLNSLMMYVSRIAREFLEASGIECAVELSPVANDVPLSADVRHNIFMAVKESLNNIVKYAHAKNVSLAFTVEGKKLSVNLKDDGVGFAVEKERMFSEGLKNMKNRMQDIGGTCEVESEVNKGTVVRISVLI